MKALIELLRALVVVMRRKLQRFVIRFRVYVVKEHRIDVSKAFMARLICRERLDAHNAQWSGLQIAEAI